MKRIFEAVMAGVEQSLLVIEDEPRQKVMFELVRRCFPSPWGQPAEGTLEDLENITPSSVRQQFRRCVHPQGAILGIAGNVTLDELSPILDEAFGDWSGHNQIVLKTGARGVHRDHISHESTQTHIGVSYPAVPYGTENYYHAWAAVNVLSGGMSSRLFTEVREKRALCYSVYASLNSIKTEGQVLCYAGTTSERAQETLDVLLRELVRLGEGIEEEELSRCKGAGPKSFADHGPGIDRRPRRLARPQLVLPGPGSSPWKKFGQKSRRSQRDRCWNTSSRIPHTIFTVLTIGPEPLVS